MKKTKTKPITWTTCVQLGIEAECDYRTVRKVYEGKPVRKYAGKRARAALIKAGYAPPELREA